MSGAELSEERSYAMHQVVAAELRRDPSKLVVVANWIRQRQADPEYSVHSKDSLCPWLEIIEQHGLPGVLRVLNDRSESGVEMRHCSPFAVVMPQEERRRILKEYETRRTGAYSSGV